MGNLNKLYLGDSSEVLKSFGSGTVQTVISSPEYWGNSRWYKTSLDDFLAEQRRVFQECFRVLKDDGTMFINVYDHFIPEEKQYLNVPAKLDAIIRDIGFLSPQPVIFWVRDTSLPAPKKIQSLVEYIFVYSKIPNPKLDREKLRTKAKYNKDRRLDKTGTATKPMPNVWEINKVFADGREHKKIHSCPFPPKLVENCLLLATDEGDVVLDPFLGSGTSCYVAKGMNRQYIGIEIDKDYYNDALKNMETGTSVYKTSSNIQVSQKTLF